MKKLVIGLVLFLSAVSFAAQKGDVTIKGMGFVAPQVQGKENVGNPKMGDIIFDTNDSQFYGRDSDDQIHGNWIQFSAAQAVLPSGVILPFGGTSEPNGYYFCDGRALQITGNEALYAAIGVAFGDGTKNSDGTTSSGYAAGTAFNLPDMRGRFIRGVAGTSGRDPDVSGRTASNTGGNTLNAVGSLQPDQLKSHTHNFTVGLSGGGTVPANGQGSYVSNTTSAAGGNETRPINIYTNYIIKR